VRYRLPQILPDGKHLLLLSDEPGYERFEIHPLRQDFEKVTEEVVIIDNPDLGRVTSFVPAPKGSLVARENHRCELIIMDLEAKNLKPRPKRIWFN
jgi:tricorn protease